MNMAHQETFRNPRRVFWIEKIKTFLVIGCVVYLALALHRAYILRQIGQALRERETTAKKMGNVDEMRPRNVQSYSAFPVLWLPLCVNTF